MDWIETLGTALEVTSKVAGFFEPIVPGANLVEKITDIGAYAIKSGP